MDAIPQKEDILRMSYSLNSLKGGVIGNCIWDYYRAYEGDTTSLDYSSYWVP